VTRRGRVLFVLTLELNVSIDQAKLQTPLIGMSLLLLFGLTFLISAQFFSYLVNCCNLESCAFACR
jgi:hypothetical protein